MLVRLTPDSTVPYWAASLAIIGADAGMAMLAVPITLADDDVPIGNAFMVFSQQLGGALSNSWGQTSALLTLLGFVPKRLPDVSVQAVVSRCGSYCFCFTRVVRRRFDNIPGYLGYGNFENNGAGCSCCGRVSAFHTGYRVVEY